MQLHETHFYVETEIGGREKKGLASWCPYAFLCALVCGSGEAAIDAGGVAREFWSLLSEQLFHPFAGLFMYSATDQLTYQVHKRVITEVVR